MISLQPLLLKLMEWRQITKHTHARTQALTLNSSRAIWNSKQEDVSSNYVIYLQLTYTSTHQELHRYCFQSWIKWLNYLNPPIQRQLFIQRIEMDFDVNSQSQLNLWYEKPLCQTHIPCRYSVEPKSGEIQSLFSSIHLNLSLTTSQSVSRVESVKHCNDNE